MKNQGRIAYVKSAAEEMTEHLVRNRKDCKSTILTTQGDGHVRECFGANPARRRDGRIPNRRNWRASNEVEQSHEYADACNGENCSPENNFVPHSLHDSQLKHSYTCLAGRNSNDAKRLSNDLQLVRLYEFIECQISKMLSKSVECSCGTEGRVTREKYLVSKLMIKTKRRACGGYGPRR